MYVHNHLGRTCSGNLLILLIWLCSVHQYNQRRVTADIQVRLVDSLYPGDGYVQTRFTNSNWTTVCSSDWDIRDANVVCKHLGFSHAYGIDPEGTLSTDLGDIVVNNVFCNGNENVFGHCWLGNYDSHCIYKDSTLVFQPGVNCAEFYELNGVSVPLCGCHHCGHPSATNPFNDPRKCCKCDCACVAIGDCCPDFNVNIHCSLNDPRDLTINDVNIAYYQCIGVPGSQRTNSGYVLVSKCPETWTDINTRLNCEVERNITDVVGLLPVYDSNKVVYKNIFCASCHNKNIDEVTFWKVEEVSSDWGYDIDYSVSSPDWEVKPRSCPFELVDSCAPDVEDPKLITACQSYFAPVGFEEYDSVFFRNPHCALCNDKGTDFSRYCKSCGGQICPPHNPEDPCSYVACCSYEECYPFLTVEVLFDFRELQSNTFGQANSISCKEDAVYDPFLKQCRSLSCPPDFVLVNGNCQPLNPPSPNTIETEVIGTENSLHSMDCLLKSVGFSSSSEIGAINIIAKEKRQEITKCLSINIGCDTIYRYTVSLLFLFQSNIKLLNFTNALETKLLNESDYHTHTPPICNVTSISTIIRYSDKFALPSQCDTFVTNTSEEFNVRNYCQLLSYARYDYITNNYSTSTCPQSCLINTHLNCSLTLTLNRSEFDFINTPSQAIHMLTSNSTITRNEYLLLSDGSIQICPFIPSLTVSSRSVLDIIAVVCTFLSVAALVATLVTYLVFPSLRNLAGALVLNLVVALLLAYLGLLLAGLFLYNDTACTTWAALTHIFWLGAFTWMMLFAFNIAKTFSRRGASTQGASSSSFRKHMLIGWITPIIVVGVCLGVHFCQCTSIVFRYGSLEERTCFLLGPFAVLLAFVVPISVLLLLSFSFFISMAIQLRRQRRASKMARSGGKIADISCEVVIYLRLSSVIGATWMFAFLYILIPESVIVKYIYTILNSLQGVFIFLAFGLTRRVRAMWRDKLTEITSSNKTTGSSRQEKPLKPSPKNTNVSSTKPKSIDTNDTSV